MCMMDIQKVWMVCYSAAGATEKVVNVIAETLADGLGVPLAKVSFTKPADRVVEYTFGEKDLVVVGAPTYAGKLPNKILPDFQTKLHGNGALAVAAVTFGNRSYDNSLAEMCAVLEADGFHTVAGGAFVCRHAFTDVLAKDRPNRNDQQQMREFAGNIIEKVRELTDIPVPVQVSGDADAPYYIPKGTDGQPAKFLKAKPKTDVSKCTSCGICAQACPTGAIDPADVSNVPGICIKCHACVRRCPEHARFFDDPAFLSHVAMLETNFQASKENVLFL